MTETERSIAICLFRNGDRILVARGYDDVAEEWFLRPLGGEIEAGESAAETVVRELREETGLLVEDVTPIGVIDNAFTYRGEPHRETVHVMDGRFADESVYARDGITIEEPVWEGPATWIDLSDLPSEPLYPTGLRELLLREP